MEFNGWVQASTSPPRPNLKLPNFMSVPASDLDADHLQMENGRDSSFKNELEQQMQGFWKELIAEVSDNPSDVRVANALPFARIKKAIKSVEEVKYVRADTPVVIAKACEMFIMELSQRAWIRTQHNERKVIKREDVANAIRDENDVLAFLEDVVPVETVNTAQDFMQ